MVRLGLPLPLVPGVAGPAYCEVNAGDSRQAEGHILMLLYQAGLRTSNMCKPAAQRTETACDTAVVQGTYTYNYSEYAT